MGALTNKTLLFLCNKFQTNDILDPTSEMSGKIRKQFLRYRQLSSTYLVDNFPYDVRLIAQLGALPVLSEMPRLQSRQKQHFKPD